MICCEVEKETVMTIDLHRLTVKEAFEVLDSTIKYAPKGTREIVVIHGYHSGTALLNLVRNEYRNRKVKRQYLGLNQGITTLIIS